MYSGLGVFPALLSRSARRKRPGTQAASRPAAQRGNVDAMKSIAVQPRDDAYAIEVPLPARNTLASLPNQARAAILRRLAEISYVANSLRSWMNNDAHDAHSTMFFEVA